MLEAALDWPRQGDDWLRTTLIGGVLVLTSFFVIPGLILYGYLLEAIGAALDGQDAPPPFRGVGGLLIDGMLVFVVAFLYALAPIALFLVGATTIGVGVVRGGDPGATAGILGVALVLATALVALAVGYVLPAALVRLAERRSVTAALDVGALADVVVTEEYAVGWLIAAVIVVVGGAIAGALMPILVGFLVQFYVVLSTVHVFGRAYARATGRDAA